MCAHCSNIDTRSSRQLVTTHAWCVYTLQPSQAPNTQATAAGSAPAAGSGVNPITGTASGMGTSNNNYQRPSGMQNVSAWAALLHACKTAWLNLFFASPYRAMFMSVLTHTPCHAGCLCCFTGWQLHHRQAELSCVGCTRRQLLGACRGVGRLHFHSLLTSQRRCWLQCSCCCWCSQIVLG
jgi:hypothetical protein